MATELDLATSFIPALHKPSSLLPIARHRQDLLYLIETYPITIVVGQTGSGKTTQIPQFLREAGWCQDGKVIAVTQVGESTPPWYHLRVIAELLEWGVAKASGSHHGSGESGRGSWMQIRRRSWLLDPL